MTAGIPLPTAEELAAARWFGGKAAAIRTVELEDRIDLGGGAAISILLVNGDPSLRLDRGTGGVRDRGGDSP